MLSRLVYDAVKSHIPYDGPATAGLQMHVSKVLLPKLQTIDWSFAESSYAWHFRVRTSRSIYYYFQKG